MTTIRSSRIVLAHAREDKERVRNLYRDLKSQGFEPWLDEEDLLPGQNWKVEIQKAIRAAGVFVACLSKHSITKKGFVQTELKLALTALGERPAGTIYFIPAKLEDCDIPDLQIPKQGSSLEDLHWGELWHPGGLQRLILAIRTALDVPDTASASLTQANQAAPFEFVVHAFPERGAQGLAGPRQDDQKVTAPRLLIGDPGPSPNPATIFKELDAPWCPEMVVIPAGSFLVGSPEGEEGRSPDEGPQHEVTFARPFALGRYPVTFDEYDHFCAETRRGKPGDLGWGRGLHPVINVSWEDAESYCKWLSDVTTQPYRLPSEAEREYACRAGTTTPFWTGATIRADQANYDGNYTYGHGAKGPHRQRTTPVDSFPANPWELHDLHGNVWEWCADRWHGSYAGAPDNGAPWLQGKDSRRVMRGGSWSNSPGLLRSATRYWFEPGGRSDSLGFRVSRTLTP